jgi:hypothetical protein
MGFTNYASCHRVILGLNIFIGTSEIRDGNNKDL